jgi:hypothetical protein
MICVTLLDEEVLQRVLPNRSVSFSDLAASLLGIAFFYWIGEIWNDQKNK